MSTSPSRQSHPDLTARLAADLLTRRDGEAMLHGMPLAQLAELYGTPLYIYDADALIRQYQRLRRALPDAIEIFYSVKANPHPSVIGVFVQQGAGCEIASAGEYSLARRAGIVPEKIIFAGPGKGVEELEFVTAAGIGEIHVESLEEIRALEDIAKSLSRPIHIAVRLNPSAALGGGLLMGGQPTAFGFEEESLDDVLREILACAHLKFRGVHLYAGTQILDAESLLNNWRYAVDLARRAAQLIGQPISTIDLGGGLGIPYFAHEKELDLAVLSEGAQALVKSVRSDPQLGGARLLVEPGRFLAGPAGMYVARVRSVKTCRGTTFVVLDGGMNHNLAASGNLGQVVRRDYPILNLSREDTSSEMTVVVVGPLCTPIDTLGRKITLPRTQPGDLLGILQSGAYGLTASPVQFLSHPSPAEVLVRGSAHEAITARRSCVA